jgi:katanin p60 ATPase-containing subunit A1
MYRYDISADDLKRQIRELHLKIEEAGNGRRTEQAASCLRKTAECYRRLAKLETNVLESTRLNKKALEYEARAKAPAGPVEEPISNNDQQGYDEIVSGFMLKNSGVKWDDIGGLDQTKHDLKYAMGLQLAKKPEGMKHLDIPSRILLYGGSGGGKTLLAAGAANMLGAQFFNVKVSDLLSKYFGESTKLISALYTKARDVADASGSSLVFIDEIESLVADRDKSDFGPERRIISTILSELDGLAQKNGSNNVITIAATNRPWDLDSAILSRMDLRIFVDWPDETTREAIFRIHLEKRGHQLDGDVSYEDLAAMTDGLTGRDIQRICKRSILNVMASMNAAIPDKVDRGEIRDYALKSRSFKRKDFADVLGQTAPDGKIVAQERKRFEDWRSKVGDA